MALQQLSREKRASPVPQFTALVDALVRVTANLGRKERLRGFYVAAKAATHKARALSHRLYHRAH